MYSIAKSVKGREFLYSKDSVIYVGSLKRAEKLAEFMNSHNETSYGKFKCNNSEVWYVHQDIFPVYKLKSVKGKITITTWGS